MKLFPECFPCIIKQSLNAAKAAKVTEEKIQIEIMLQVCKELNKVDDFQTAPHFSARIQSIVKNFSGIDDPYYDIKETNLANALKYLPYLKAYINNANDKLEEAVRAAILGNIIDLGANPDFNLDYEINKISSDNIVLNDYKLFKDKIKKAEYILYIGDNAEEVIFDKLLIEQLLPREIIFAVRHNPILNDVTIDFAKKVGLDKITEVISSGSKIAGTDLNEANEKFLNYFNNAPVVIAKGQGNYETLESCGREIFFMFKVKCDSISRRTGYEIGTSVLLKLPK